MSKRRSLPLRERTALMIAGLMIILLLVLIVCFNMFISGALVEESTGGMSQNLHLIAQKLDMLTGSVEDSAVTMLANDAVQLWLTVLDDTGQDDFNLRRETSRYLVNISQSDYITNVALFPNNGEIDDYAMIPYADEEEEEFLRSFLASGRRSVWNLGRPVVYSQGPREVESSPYVLTYYHKVYSKWTLRPLGVLAIMVSERNIASLYQDIVLGETGYCYITGADGRVVSSVDMAMLGVEMAAVPDDDVAVSISYPSLGWTIRGRAPRGEITGSVRYMWVYTLLIGCAVILPGVWVSYMLAGSISKPIVELEHIVLGEEKPPIENHPRRDEISSLYAAFFQMREKNEELTRKTIEDGVRQKEYELNLLQAQLNPHFLYNTLECICGLSLMGKNEEVVKATTELALFYRGVLSERSRFVPIRKELEMVRRFFSIIQYRFPGKLNYNIACEESLEEEEIVKLSLQPIVENAVLHGLRNSRRDWEVTVRVYRVEGGAEISVWDNGVGMTTERVEEIFSDRPLERFHFGLRATADRLRLAYGEGYGLNVFSEPGEGTLVVMRLPGTKGGGKGEGNPDV